MSTNNFFCMAPWTHTFLSPQSERRLCCASRENSQFTIQYLDQSQEGKHKNINYNPQTIQEYWNSEFIRNIRLKMIKGAPPPECVICHSKELNIQTYKDYFTKILYPHLIQEAIDSTDQQGFTSMKPRSFDYRLTNQCNFKCRMCGDQLSSEWERENRKFKSINFQTDRWLEESTNKKIKLFQENTAQNELTDAIKNGEVDEIYWVGGEPLIWKSHWEIMINTIKIKQSKNIFCRYNTNLSVLKYKNKHIIQDVLRQFKGFRIAISIDAPGKIGEYIRTGLNWKKCLENIKEVKALSDPRKNQTIYLDLTLTLPGLFGLKELIQISNELDIFVEPKLVFAFDPSITISPLALPREILEPIIDDLIIFTFKHLTVNTIQILVFLKNLKKRETHQEKYPKDYIEGFIQGKKNQLILENRRSDQFTLNDIYKENESVLRWWNQYEQ